MNGLGEKWAVLGENRRSPRVNSQNECKRAIHFSPQDRPLSPRLSIFDWIIHCRDRSLSEFGPLTFENQPNSFLLLLLHLKAYPVGIVSLTMNSTVTAVILAISFEQSLGLRVNYIPSILLDLSRIQPISYRPHHEIYTFWITPLSLFCDIELNDFV